MSDGQESRAILFQAPCATVCLSEYVGSYALTGQLVCAVPGACVTHRSQLQVPSSSASLTLTATSPCSFAGHLTAPEAVDAALTPESGSDARPLTPAVSGRIFQDGKMHFK
uniref:Uncharacterized protein n=1 Tax=Knipowitschia caucasica TaxID=637954 RepID=A0AAV2LG39_KNICA